jgi:small-conductance mechanosensitive channel
LKYWLTVEASFQVLHISLGAVLAFGLTIWLATLFSRFIRFLLEEAIYDRFHFKRGTSYAISTLLHYVVLLAGLFLGSRPSGWT